MATHGEIRWPSMGTFDGRLRGDSHGRRQHREQAPVIGRPVPTESVVTTRPDGRDGECDRLRGVHLLALDPWD